MASDYFLAMKRDGVEIILNISDEVLEKICKEKGLPVVKHGDMIKTVCKCGCGGYGIRRIVGVARCNQRSSACSPGCPLKDGEEVGLWLSSKYNDKKVVLFNSERSFLELLN